MYSGCPVAVCSVVLVLAATLADIHNGLWERKWAEKARMWATFLASPIADSLLEHAY